MMRGGGGGIRPRRSPLSGRSRAAPPSSVVLVRMVPLLALLALIGCAVGVVVAATAVSVVRPPVVVGASVASPPPLPVGGRVRVASSAPHHQRPRRRRPSWLLVVMGTTTVPAPVRGVLCRSSDASGAGVDAHATVVGKEARRRGCYCTRQGGSGSCVKKPPRWPCLPPALHLASSRVSS
jgi:hypothetical protein